MPEMPEVITVARALDKRISNQKITDVLINLPKIIKEVSPEEFKKQVIGKKILKVTNEGKWIVVKLEDDVNIIIHLRMEGKFRTGKVDGTNPKHDHVVFKLSDNKQLFFNDTRQFATMHLRYKDFKEIKPISSLGKHFKDIDGSWLKQKLSTKRVAIKSALLDQTIVIGLGNIYVNEVLWHAKVNPLKPSKDLTDKEYDLIVKYSTEVLEEATKLGGSSIKSYSSLDGIKGTYQEKLKVHMKENEPCFRCGTPIAKMKVNGRGTYYCPNCQK